MRTNIITVICIVLSKLSFGQYQQYEQYITPFLSAPIESGFFYFTTPNNFQAGQLYQLYRQNAPDLNNNMILIDQHVDSLIGYTHYKYQQTYMNIPIEGTGCIEHYDTNGSLSYINAKIADSIKKSHIPKISKDKAIDGLIKSLKKEGIVFAWEDEDWEKQMQLDNDDEHATWYPSAKLIWAIDTMKNVQLIIPGNRFTLAYKIPVTIVSPEYETFYYYINANTGDILKVNSTHRHDGPATIPGYGTRIIDTRWKGGFTQGYILNTNDATRNIHTKKNHNGTAAWWTISETKTSNDVWGLTYETETATHYHVSNSWDYFRNVFGRTGQDNSGREIRVRSQWNQNNAVYTANPSSSFAEMIFGKTSSNRDWGTEPSVVAHEFTHGVIYHTTDLEYAYESGALNESFCDIFGIVIHAKMLDGGSTDWTLGNFIPSSSNERRSLSNPNTLGIHFQSGNQGTGQPNTYNGNYWYSGNLDNGGIHVNSGVQNKWFYILANGESDYNDHSNQYNVEGIGIDKATNIAYYAMTSGLLSSSQYSDARQSTINYAKNQYGECSKEHKAVIDAWYAVGIGNPNSCPVLSVDQIEEQTILVYPNPSSGSLTIDIPQMTTNSILMYDISGKLVKEIKGNSTFFTEDISSLEDGVYLLNFNFDGKLIVKRVILQK